MIGSVYGHLLVNALSNRITIINESSSLRRIESLELLGFPIIWSFLFYRKGIRMAHFRNILLDTQHFSRVFHLFPVYVNEQPVISFENFGCNNAFFSDTYPVKITNQFIPALGDKCFEFRVLYISEF